VGSYTNSTTQFAETSSTKAFRQDGYSMGYLETYKIDQKGVITGVYSNGTERDLGQIAMASFTNPGGLEKVGETAFSQSINSGEALLGPSGIAGKGKIVSGTLEMSNVDLAEQFTDMIVTQRGFQSNSKTIQTSDQMLQELLTLKR
jgi:flagellar hook protein FlgE